MVFAYDIMDRYTRYDRWMYDYNSMHDEYKQYILSMSNTNHSTNGHTKMKVSYELNIPTHAGIDRSLQRISWLYCGGICAFFLDDNMVFNECDDANTHRYCNKLSGILPIAVEWYNREILYLSDQWFTLYMSHIDGNVLMRSIPYENHSNVSTHYIAPHHLTTTMNEVSVSYGFNIKLYDVSMRHPTVSSYDQLHNSNILSINHHNRHTLSSLSQSGDIHICDTRNFQSKNSILNTIRDVVSYDCNPNDPLTLIISYTDKLSVYNMITNTHIDTRLTDHKVSYVKWMSNDTILCMVYHHTPGILLFRYSHNRIVPYDECLSPPSLLTIYTSSCSAHNHHLLYIADYHPHHDHSPLPNYTLYHIL